MRVHRVAREHHGVGPGRVGHADHGARVARIGHAVQHRDQSGTGPHRLRERHVHQVAHRDQALRRHGLRQRRGGLVGHPAHRHARLDGVAHQLRVAIGRDRGDEQLVHPPPPGGGPGERLAHRLGALGEEPLRAVAPGAAGQSPSGNDPGCPLGERSIPGSWCALIGAQALS
ncbi:hypothetical protein GCM10010185_24150 [Saccharothrix coeruleofusca]|uniref:Uncharacterized protein n=1 Tax=Saccharothrix coeruleofusca TaxID=33919 RepID=A0A918AJR5_9PSEU|nr:hypothetical protein GCM10010185_24150 [Saccharothrix coeruleofusca]